MTARDFATLMLQFGSWLCLVSAIVVPTYMIAESIPADGTMRIAGAVAWAINGLIAWAALSTLARISDEVREMHHRLSRAGE